MEFRRRHAGLLRIDALLWLAALILIACAGLKLRPRPAPSPSWLDRPIAEITLAGTPLDEAIKKMGHAAGVTITVDWRALTANQLDPKTPVSLHFRDVTLRIALKHLPLGQSVFENEAAAVRITSLDALPVETRVYDVGDIVDRMLLSRFGWPISELDTESKLFQPTLPPTSELYDRDDYTLDLAHCLANSDQLERSNVDYAGPGVIVLRGPRRAHDALAAVLRRLRETNRVRPWTPRPLHPYSAKPSF